MKISKRQLRRIIRESITVASATDLQRMSPVIKEWAEVLLEELADELPNGNAINDFTEKKRNRIISELVSTIKIYLIEALGFPMDGYSRKQMKKSKERETVKKYRERMGY